MTGMERSELADFKEEVRIELNALREAVAPAVHLANVIARIGDVVADAGRFIKWGVGVGAGIVTIILGLRALGLL